MAVIFGLAAFYFEPVRMRPLLRLFFNLELWRTFEDLLAFQERSFPDDLIEMDRTRELWVPRKAKVAAEGPSLL